MSGYSTTVLLCSLHLVIIHNILTTDFIVIVVVINYKLVSHNSVNGAHDIAFMDTSVLQSLSYEAPAYISI